MSECIYINIYLYIYIYIYIYISGRNGVFIELHVLRKGQ